MSSDEIDLDPKLGAKLPSAPAAPGVGGPSPLAASTTVDPSTSIETNVEIAQALSAGHIDSTTARELLIDQVLREQMPRGAAPEQLEQARAQLELLLRDDPTLASLLRA